MSRRYLFIVAAACLAAPAAAADGEQQGASAADRSNEVVCRRMGESETGSHMRRSRRVCQTRGEWAATEEATQRRIREMRQRGGTTPAAEGGVGAGGPE